MTTGPEHYAEAERLLAHAQGILDDDSMDTGPRDEYPTEDEFFAAMEMHEQASVSGEQTASVYSQLAQVHATLALAAATAAQIIMRVPDSLAGEEWSAAMSEPRDEDDPTCYAGTGAPMSQPGPEPMFAQPAEI